MSYLNLPRIQFGGLFFTAPSTINNYQHSYDENVKLTNAEGQYLSDPPIGGPAGWNATGVAQLWLQECRVLSVVGPDGTLQEAEKAARPGAGSSDPILQALVETPSSTVQKKTPDGKGLYDIAKLVDLDPIQQFRTRGYGLRVYVTQPDGSGFSGLLTSPELRFLVGRVPGARSSWGAVGNWTTVLTELDWFGDIASGSFLSQFQSACSGGVSFHIAMDLHQNNPANRLTQGDMFCYGRVLGSLGPAQPSELAQVVPGRILRTVSTQQASPQAAAGDEAAGPDRLDIAGLTMDERVERLGTEVLTSLGTTAEAGDSLHSWNPALAQTSTIEVAGGAQKHFLHLDLSFALQLATSGGKAMGKFEVNSGIQAGYMTGPDPSDFQPFANGAISFEDQYTWHESQNKTCYLVDNSGMVDILLAGDEQAQIRTCPLAIQLAGFGLVVQEPADGYFMDLQWNSLRLYSNEPQNFQLMVRKFGQPQAGIQPPVTTQTLVYTGTGQSGTGPTQDIQLQIGATDPNGLATVTVQGPQNLSSLPVGRQPLDSQIYFAYFNGPDGQPISDGNTNYNLSLLYWPPYSAPSTPTWDQDVGPILQAYARLYPGMKGRLDIGDETTVKSSAKGMYARMDPAIFDDPAYMPVTRDLCPPKARMIRAWLEPYTKT